MPARAADRVLTINTGSSSLKLGLFDVSGGERREILVTKVEVERIGGAETPDHAAALRSGLARIGAHAGLDLSRLRAVSHRVVFGGPRVAPQLVDDALLRDVERLVPYDRNHLPQALAAIAAVSRELPGVPQVACFDTAFHASLPRVARLFPLPRRVADAGVLRYGFHGLSCESILSTLEEEGVSASKLVIAHLGNGASLTAVEDGASVDTTMGFTPTGGIVMGTRPGDLDPGVILFLLREERLDVDELDRLLNRESGLAGLSGGTSDMRDLLAREAGDTKAAEAVALFCRSARQALGRMVAVLGGLDLLVFTGGIGEHAPEIRRRVASGLGIFGLALDDAANTAGSGTISAAGSPAAIRVIHTDEDRILARHASVVLGGS